MLLRLFGKIHCLNQSHEKGACAADNESRLDVFNSSCPLSLALKGFLCNLCEELPSVL